MVGPTDQMGSLISSMQFILSKWTFGSLPPLKLHVGWLEPPSNLNFDEEKLAVWHKNNQDGYGARIIEFAIHWSKLISLFKKDFSVNEAVKMACSDADFDGITGFMHSAAKNILLECLKEDEETLNAIRNS